MLIITLSKMLFLSFLPFLTLLIHFPSTSPSILPSGFHETLLAENIDGISLTSGPDDTVWMVQKVGLVNQIINDVFQINPVLDIRKKVDNLNQRGLLSIALDPNFTINGFIYAYYTVVSQNHNRVSRFQVVAGSANISTEYIFIDLDPLSNTINNGGFLVIKEDYLFITTGDDGNPDYSSNLQSLHGKVLRLFLNGTIPQNNPFISYLNGNLGSIFARGLRNPVNGGVSNLTGTILINDQGFASFEEINKLTSGANYGWPVIEGKITSDKRPPLKYVDPEYAYAHVNGSCQITGAAFSGSQDAKMSGLTSDLYLFADICAGTIQAFNWRTKVLDKFVIQGIKRPLDLTFSKNNDLYYIEQGDPQTPGQEQTYMGRLFKVQYTGNGIPTFSFQPKNATVLEGSNVVFGVGAQGEQLLHYQWQVDGKNIIRANSDNFTLDAVTLAESGKSFTVIVYNKLGRIVSLPAYLTVLRNTTLKAVIIFPEQGTKFLLGTKLNFSGYGVDTFGVLPASACTWEIVYHQDDWTQASDMISGVYNGSQLLEVNQQSNRNGWFEVTLIVKDARGFSAKTSVKVFPTMVTIFVNSVPRKMVVEINGVKCATPFNFTTVAGSETNIAARNQTYNGKVYGFSGWSINGSAIQNVIFAETKAIHVYFEERDSVKNGIQVEYFPGEWADFPDASTLVPSQKGILQNFTIPAALNNSSYRFLLLYTTYLNISQENNYNFQISATEPFKLVLTSQEIVVATNYKPSGSIYDGLSYQGSISLPVGAHKVKLYYMQNTTSEPSLEVQYSAANQDLEAIPPSAIYLENPDTCSFQMITFNPLPNVINYTLEHSFDVSVLTSSSLDVTFSIQGPGNFDDATTVNEGLDATVVLKGQAGILTITASQGGDIIFCPALSVTKKILIVGGDGKAIKDPDNPGGKNGTSTVMVVNSDGLNPIAIGLAVGVSFILTGVVGYLIVKKKIFRNCRTNARSNGSTPTVIIPLNQQTSLPENPQVPVRIELPPENDVVPVPDPLENVLAGLEESISIPSVVLRDLSVIELSFDESLPKIEKTELPH